MIIRSKYTGRVHTVTARWWNAIDYKHIYDVIDGSDNVGSSGKKIDVPQQIIEYKKKQTKK